MQLLIKKHFFEINDETVEAFNKVKYDWSVFATRMENKSFARADESEIMMMAAEGFFFFQSMLSAFRRSMEKVAGENALEKLRGQQ